MITKLGILNFQSIEKLQVELGPISVFVGESDSGKSAVVRALYAAAFNDYPSDHVREGAKHSTVVVGLEDGSVVSAEKGGNRNHYTARVEGRSLKWERVGRDVPEEVAAALGWRVVELDDGTKFVPSIQRQFDGPFLLADSPSRVAKVLGSLTNISTLFAAIREGTLEEKRARREADAAVDEGKRHSAALSEAQEAAERATARAERARSAFQAVEDRVADLEAVERLLADIEFAREKVQTEAGILERVRSRQVVFPDVEDLELAVQELVTLRSLEEDWVRALDILETCQADWGTAFDRHADAEKVFEAYVEDMDVCPVCERPMDEVHEGQDFSEETNSV